jgi:hypothetical protein
LTSRAAGEDTDQRSDVKSQVGLASPLCFGRREGKLEVRIKK